MATNAPKAQAAIAAWLTATAPTRATQPPLARPDSIAAK